MSFLRAEWRKLALANYPVDPDLLRPYVPYGTELDFWKGQCYVSLVGFMFLETQVLGLKIPFHVNFEEVNLRFYVRRKVDGEWRRGVVFIKEIVPRYAIAWVANTLYREHYECLPMRHRWSQDTNRLQVCYEWKKAGVWHSIDVIADSNLIPVEAGSDAEFITEHYWGYAHRGVSNSNEYQVAHPHWEQYAVQAYKVQVDFAKIYGERFRLLDGMMPESVMLAEGSPVEVMGKATI